MPKMVACKQKTILEDSNTSNVAPHNAPSRACIVLVEPNNFLVRVCNRFVEAGEVLPRQLLIVGNGRPLTEPLECIPVLKMKGSTIPSTVVELI